MGKVRDTSEQRILEQLGIGQQDCFAQCIRRTATNAEGAGLGKHRNRNKNGHAKRVTFSIVNKVSEEVHECDYYGQIVTVCTVYKKEVQCTINTG